MPRARNFFTVEMGNQLRSLRQERGISLHQVARRLGLADSGGRTYVRSLERGRIRDPHLSTIIRYLRAIGMHLSDVAPRFDRVDLLPIPAEVLQDAELDAGEKTKVLARVEHDVHKYQRRMAYPRTTPPLPPQVQSRASEKFRDYVVLARIVRSKIDACLIEMPVKAYDRERYQVYGRRRLGALRRFTGEKLAARLAEIEEFARVNQFNPDVTAGVRQVVDEQYQHLTRDTGALARLRRERAEQTELGRLGMLRRAKLQPKVKALKPDILQQVNALLKKFYAQGRPFTGADYLAVAERFIGIWLNAVQFAEPGTPEFKAGLKQVLTIARAAFPREVYDPDLLVQLQAVVVRGLSKR